MDYYQILVIILSTFLAIFLALGIVVLILCIKIANRVKTITEKAEAVVDKVEHVGDFFQKSAGPIALARIITKMADNFQSKKSSK